MSVRAFWQAPAMLTLAAFLASGCESPAPTGPETELAEPIPEELASDHPILMARTPSLRQEVLKRFKTELWPCPQGYRPIQIHEFVPSTPPLKPPGHPEYWEQCPATPGHFTNHNSSIGTASHLGGFTNEWDSCLDLINAIGFFDAQLTAADGDRLNWEITAQATPLPQGGLSFETTNVTFDGGTGRFADATGYAAGGGNTLGEGENYYYLGCLSY